MSGDGSACGRGRGGSGTLAARVTNLDTGPFWPQQCGAIKQRPLQTLALERETVNGPWQEEDSFHASQTSIL
ncbi:hypothetical protein SGFS_021880 [Streptomyces graminofaciens]|uniref:Uncharacterized protein n=1 Tax=Streptomyces graminofaciens TaxID=68212 RepID=A0ABM7F4Z3_9ACTN|nr:hypothetical protein SGFS_021880 [Streptomyces graminofaciens]